MNTMTNLTDMSISLRPYTGPDSIATHDQGTKVALVATFKSTPERAKLPSIYALVDKLTDAELVELVTNEANVRDVLRDHLDDCRQRVMAITYSGYKGEIKEIPSSVFDVRAICATIVSAKSRARAKAKVYTPADIADWLDAHLMDTLTCELAARQGVDLSNPETLDDTLAAKIEALADKYRTLLVDLGSGSTKVVNRIREGEKTRVQLEKALALVDMESLSGDEILIHLISRVQKPEVKEDLEDML